MRIASSKLYPRGETRYAEDNHCFLVFKNFVQKNSKIYIELFEIGGLSMSPQPKILPPPKYKEATKWFLGVFFARWAHYFSFVFNHAQMLDQSETFILVIVILFESKASSADDLWTLNSCLLVEGSRDHSLGWLQTFLFPAHSYWENLTLWGVLSLAVRKLKWKEKWKIKITVRFQNARLFSRHIKLGTYRHG